MSRTGPTWQPKPEDYRRIFREQNPWQESGNVPTAWAPPVERPLVRDLPARLLADEPRRFQLILGPRRVGKTTCMYQVVRRLIDRGVPADRLWWLRLDHPLLLQRRLDELVREVLQETGATPAAPTYLFLDELAYADHWDLWLKTFYDESWPVRITATSSSTATLRERRAESGVGRWEEQFLAPYLFSEYLDLAGKGLDLPTGTTLAETIERCLDARIDVRPLRDERRRFLLTGGFPELLNALKDSREDETSLLLQSQRILRTDAIERAIYKDIPQAFGIDNPMMLERLLYTLAGQVAGVLSPQSICAELGGMSQPTFSRYIGYLERAFLIFLLPNYAGTEAARQKRGRKLYFVDAAVRNAALQRGLGPLHDTGEMGLLVENMIAGHLHALGQESQVRLYHWRHKGQEIDFIHDHPAHPLGFEVTTSDRHHRAGIAAFATRFSRFRGRCYLVAPGVLATRPEANSDQIGTLPLDLFLLAISAHTREELRRRLRAEHPPLTAESGDDSGPKPPPHDSTEPRPD